MDDKTQTALEAAKQRHPSNQNKPDPIIWYAQLSESMIALLENEERTALIDELDDAVAAICEHYGV